MVLRENVGDDSSSGGAGATSPPISDADAAVLPRAELGAALRVAAGAIWDRLGLVVFLSLTWSVLLSIPTTLARLIYFHAGAGAVLICAPPLAACVLSAPLAGICNAATLVLGGREAGCLDVWRGAVHFGWASTRLGAIHSAVVLALVLNLRFYLSVGGLFGSAAALVCAYAALLWALCAMYSFPVLVAQEAGVFDEPDRRARRGALGALRRSFYLVIGSLFYSLGALVVLLAIGAALVFSAIGIVLVGAGGAAIVLTSLMRVLLIRYGVISRGVQEPVVSDLTFRMSLNEGGPPTCPK